MFRPKLLTLFRPQVWRSRNSMKDYRRTNVVAQYRRVGQKVNCLSKTAKFKGGFFLVRCVEYTEDLHFIIA